MKGEIMKKTITSLFILAAMGVSFAYADNHGNEAEMVVKGGQIYDRYYTVTGADEPEGNGPSYANKAGKYDGIDSWRCKECHGWDYIGDKGRYSKGSHYSGIKGIEGAKDKSSDEIKALLRDASHGYTEEMIPDADMEAVAKFIQIGQFDMYQYIDKETGEITGGNVEAGQAAYTKSCAMCHGAKGDMSIGDEDSIGEITRGNPPETLHKTLFGHPPEPLMPPMYKEGIETSIDILKYMSTMP